MSVKNTEIDSPVAALKNESARQRWELFHRAIAFAKESNQAALVEADLRAEQPETPTPLLTVVR